jgi:hypothetical protein
MPTGERIETYGDFWPYYLQQHSKPRTRAIHYLGTGLAFFSILALIATFNPWFVLLALVAGYGPAWIGHFFVENNRPATFTYPLWSLFSDFRMAWDWLSGTLAGELQKAGVTPANPPLTLLVNYISELGASLRTPVCRVGIVSLHRISTPVPSLVGAAHGEPKCSLIFPGTSPVSLPRLGRPRGPLHAVKGCRSANG